MFHWLSLSNHGVWVLMLIAWTVLISVLAFWETPPKSWWEK